MFELLKNKGTMTIAFMKVFWIVKLLLFILFSYSTVKIIFGNLKVYAFLTKQNKDTNITIATLAVQ